MPRAKETPIRALHPTQLTVGMAEVKEKRDHLAGLGAPERKRFMEEHPIPAVVGPGGKLFLTDHHHLGRAALEAGVEAGYVEVAADLSKLAGDAFWREMDERAWVHPLDQNGVRHRYDRIPQRLEQLVDDVYRSLAGFVRASGGYEKTPSPFAEFEWADFFRRLIPIEEVEADLGAAVKVAVRHARSERARRMPGYAGKA
ncbi:MAG TPA: ParB-like protein [Anaeromyxobacter sp.]|nr:ParB-like protein [Anaeromyxobacter sp.]